MIMLAHHSSVFSFDESIALEISSHNTSHTKNERQPLPYTVWMIEYVVKHELFELVNMVAFGMIVLGPSSPVFSSNQIGKSSAIEMLSHNTSCTKNNQPKLCNQVCSLSLFRWRTLYSAENIKRLCVFMFQTCSNSLLCTDSQYSSQ